MTKQTKPKNTDIKFTQIKQRAKQSHIKETYELPTGETIRFYPTFPPTMIEELFKEVQSVFATKPEEIELSDELTHKYILYMTIKHFTHLKSQLKAVTFVEQLNEMEAVINAGLFDVIVNEVFVQQEINKIFGYVTKFGSNIAYLEKLNNQFHEEIEKLDLQNKDIIFPNKIKNEIGQ